MSYPSPMTYEWDFSRHDEDDWIKPPKRVPTTTKWQCGNPKKRKKLVQEFTKVSGVHGTAYLCSSKGVSKCTQIFYRILFSVCCLLVTANVVFLIQETWSSESSYVNSINKATRIGIEEDPDYFPTYPRITICRKPFYRTDFNESYLQLVQYAALTVGFPFSSLTPEEMSHLATIIMYGAQVNFSTEHPRAAAFRRYLQGLRSRFQGLKDSQKNFDLKGLIHRTGVECEELFVSCVILVYSLDCCQIFQSVLTTMGPCYTLVNAKAIEQVMDTLPIEFSFNIDLISPPSIDREVEVGFHVFLSDFQTDNFQFSPFEGQKAVPGRVTTISAQLMKRDRTALHTAWHGLSQRCPVLPFENGVDRYSHKVCESYYVYKLMKKSCLCQSILAKGRQQPGLRFCEPVDEYECMMSIGLKSNLTDLQAVCPQPCITYSFRSDATYIGLGRENVSRVEIMYNSKQFIFHEYRTNTLSSFLSQIGGALGLYLGASIITVVEILVFVLSWIWHTCMPSRTRVRGTPDYPRFK